MMATSESLAPVLACSGVEIVRHQDDLRRVWKMHVLLKIGGDDILMIELVKCTLINCISAK
jgi:hypothetical protein